MCIFCYSVLSLNNVNWLTAAGISGLKCKPASEELVVRVITNLALIFIDKSLSNKLHEYFRSAAMLLYTPLKKCIFVDDLSSHTFRSVY